MNGPTAQNPTTKPASTLKDIARFAVRRAIADVLAKRQELQAQEELSDEEMKVVVKELEWWQAKIDPLGE